MLLLVKMILAFQIFWIVHSQKLWKASDPAKNATKPVFYRGSFENILKNKPKAYKDFCVACDICDVWFHYKCVGISRGKEQIMMMLGFVVLLKSWIQH